jgi:small nuclear ribonucleoprotein (snRNP)-like protein
MSFDLKSLIGTTVLIRGRNSGVHCGTLVECDGTVVALQASRRLWKWQALQGIALSGVAAHGLNRKGSKLDAITNIVLTDAIEIIPMTDAAARTLYE